MFYPDSETEVVSSDNVLVSSGTCSYSEVHYEIAESIFCWKLCEMRLSYLFCILDWSQTDLLLSTEIDVG